MEPVKGVTYQYQLLRYQHDHLTGEFANIGLVYYDPQSGMLMAQFEDQDVNRLHQFFGNSVQGSYLLALLKNLKAAFANIENTALRFAGIEALTSSILPPDDNGLLFSEVWTGRHLEHQQAFTELYHRIIGQYRTVEKVKRQQAKGNVNRLSSFIGILADDQQTLDGDLRLLTK